MTETKVSATRNIDAANETIFNVLSNPERHAEIDGSDMVRSDDKTDRITAVGQVFRMNMHWDKMGGDYKTDNHVVGYEENKLLAWTTAPSGEEAPGWEWVWELVPQGSDSTEVTITYDWSAVTDKSVLEQVNFPVVDQEALEGSLANLAATVA